MSRQRTLLYSHSCAPDAQTQTMPSKPEVEQYIKDNALEAALAAAVSATVKARPLDAMAYLSQELAKATKPVAPCFYTVYHEFVPGKAAAWWEQIMKQTPEENGSPLVYVCSGATCQIPTLNPKEFQAHLQPAPPRTQDVSKE